MKTALYLCIGIALGMVSAYLGYSIGYADGRTHGYRTCVSEFDEGPTTARHHKRGDVQR